MLFNWAKHSDQFGRRHHEEHYFEIILNLHLLFSRRVILRYFLSIALVAFLFSASKPFVQLNSGLYVDHFQIRWLGSGQTFCRAWSWSRLFTKIYQQMTLACKRVQDQARQNVWPDPSPNCLTIWQYSWKNFKKQEGNRALICSPESWNIRWYFGLWLKRYHLILKYTSIFSSCGHIVQLS